jgi:hypothetical protein
MRKRSKAEPKWRVAIRTRWVALNRTRTGWRWFPVRLFASLVEFVATAVPIFVAVLLGVVFGATELAEDLSTWPGFSHHTWRYIVAGGIAVSLFAAFHKVRLQRDAHVAQAADLELSVGGAVFNDPGYPDRVRIQLSVTIVNKGTPSTLHSWRLRLTIGATELEGHHVPGGEPLAGSPQWKPLDEITGTSPLPTGQVSGLLLFIVNISKERLDARSSKPDEAFSAILSVTDARQSEWTTTVDFHELMAQAYLTIPPPPPPQSSTPTPLPHPDRSAIRLEGHFIDPQIRGNVGIGSNHVLTTGPDSLFERPIIEDNIYVALPEEPPSETLDEHSDENE